VEVHNPSDMPDPSKISSIEEPWIYAKIMVPDEYLGDVLSLCERKRGVQRTLTYVSSHAMLEYQLPLNEVVYDFYDRLKSISKGYASFDYQLDGHKPEDLVKMTILINGEPADALSLIVHRSLSEYRGRQLCERLKTLIPRHMFKIPIQAAIGGKIVARETVAAFRKDVIAKCYGGDVTRKRKLLDKQKTGKKKMREIGNVKIPPGTFLEALK
jgi:GTP-binding protein LepA